MKPTKQILLILLLICTTAFSQPTKPHTFGPGDPVSSAKINSNFDTIYSWAQGLNFQTLTRGTGLTGNNYNGSAATTWAIDFGSSAGKVSEGNHEHVHIASQDTRSTNYNPTDRTRGFYPDFKANTADGLSDGGNYHGSITFRPYGSGTDVSGGYAFQLGFTENTNLWLRKGTSTTAWGSWNKFLHTGNFVSGTGSTNYCAGNDSRLSDSRTPTSHTLVSHTASGLTTGHFLKATGATTYGFAAHGLTAANVGAAATSHAHGNITSAGAIGTTANLPVITGTSGVLTTVAWPTTTPAVATTTGAIGSSNSPARSDHAHPSRISTSAPASPVNGDIWLE